jgi:hypothetical protein
MVMSTTREKVGIAVQATLGTPITTPTMTVVVDAGSFKATENFENIVDSGRRGVDALDFNAYRGVNTPTEITWTGMVRQTSLSGASVKSGVIGYLIENILGGADSKETIVSSTHFDHRLALGTQKKYFTIDHAYAGFSSTSSLDARRFEGCRVTELTIAFNSGEGVLTYSVTLQGRSAVPIDAEISGGLLHTGMTPDNESTPWMGWQGNTTFGDTGSSHVNMISGEWTFRREAAPHYSANDTREFNELFRGPLEVLYTGVMRYDPAQGAAIANLVAGAVGSTTTPTITVDSNATSTLAVGDIIRHSDAYDSDPGSELMLVTALTATVLTVVRGYLGTTAVNIPDNGRLYVVNSDVNDIRNKRQTTLSTTFEDSSAGATNLVGNRIFAIAMNKADIADGGVVELDNSGTLVTLAVSARGLYTTAAGTLSSTTNGVTSAVNSPVEVQICNGSGSDIG